MTKIIQKAIQMRDKAHTPYSNYTVGAALETKDGNIIGGCNIENSSYSLTNCAERTALFTAIAKGYSEFKALAVSTENGGSPCGACRQVIWELCGNIPVYICDDNGLVEETTSSALLPKPFDESKLR
ncbi:MAG: cytidine deaminase [Candidatus Marinimicrobia bacterium]|nr:cytidine deaminase [Candidatus Neomarinimicrobiota bacterium]MBL7010256.1 cytidine deaminase [Candidatus Neomarinimicrobiota bacterium]MBL7030222.1 cytidine deaminase [Candidatus Neomarinimicrobiota bacterium]